MSTEQVDFGSEPRSVKKNISDIYRIKKMARERTIFKYDTERYLVIIFRRRQDREEALRQLGLPQDERYIASTMVKLTRIGKVVRLVGKTPVKVADPSKSGATG